MNIISHNEMFLASEKYHILCDAKNVELCDNHNMENQDKNGGPNHLRAWRSFKKMTQKELADAVDTTQHQIAFLENGDRALTAKWLRRLAPALDTTPGLLMDHDPNDLDNDIIDIWSHADKREQRQIADIAKTIVRTGTND